MELRLTGSGPGVRVVHGLEDDRMSLAEGSPGVVAHGLEGDRVSLAEGSPGVVVHGLEDDWVSLAAL